MNPEVSVIIPTYNRAHLLKRAIWSVLNQTYKDFELIIIDDGSVDNTEHLVKGFNDKRMIYIEQFHKGAAAAENRGIEISKGRYMAFLDSDDEWLPEKLQIQMDVFKREPQKTGVVYSGGWLIKNNRRSYSPTRRSIPKKAGDLRKKLFSSGFCISLVTAVVRKECFEKVGNFDEALPAANDRDMWLRISKYFLFKYIPKPLVNIYKTPGSLSTNVDNSIEARKRLLDKYADEYRKYGRKVSAYDLGYIGSLLFQKGEIQEGWRFILKAIEAFPLNPLNYLALITSFFGKEIYFKVRKIKDFISEIITISCIKKQWRC